MFSQSSEAERPYLDYKNLVSGVTPNLKLLVVSFRVLGDAHRAHLRKERQENTSLHTVSPDLSLQLPIKSLPNVSLH